MILSYYEEIVNTRCDLKFIGFLTKDGKILNTKYKHEIEGVENLINKLLTINTQEEFEEFYIELVSSYEINRYILKDKKILQPAIYNNLILQEFIIKTVKKSDNYINFLNSIKEFLLRKNDFFVQVLNYDKVEKINKTITTSRYNYLEYFYNYLIMDFDILKIPNYRYDKSDNKLVETNVIVNKELLEEINIIKSISIDKRKMYFK